MNNSLIRVRRKLKGVTQQELSRLTGYTQAYLSLMEIGSRVPNSENLQKIAQALNCSVADISDNSLKDILYQELKSEIENLSETEIEKALDYVKMMKRGRR